MGHLLDEIAGRSQCLLDLRQFVGAHHAVRADALRLGQQTALEEAAHLPGQTAEVPGDLADRQWD